MFYSHNMILFTDSQFAIFCSAHVLPYVARGRQVLPTFSRERERRAPLCQSNMSASCLLNFPTSKYIDFKQTNNQATLNKHGKTKQCLTSNKNNIEHIH